MRTGLVVSIAVAGRMQVSSEASEHVMSNVNHRHDVFAKKTNVE